LRELRATVHSPAPTQLAWVRDGANVYQQAIRDELPDAFATGMRALRESWPTQ